MREYDGKNLPRKMGGWKKIYIGETQKRNKCDGEEQEFARCS